jgi:hypothetical protein
MQELMLEIYRDLKISQPPVTNSRTIMHVAMVFFPRLTVIERQILLHCTSRWMIFTVSSNSLSKDEGDISAEGAFVAV